MKGESMDQQLSEYRKVSGQPLRVYRDRSDTAGQVLCQPHRVTYYTLYPSAFGTGEWGGECEPCRAAGPPVLSDEQILAEECETCRAGAGDLCRKTYGWPALKAEYLPPAQSHAWRLRAAGNHAGHGPLRPAGLVSRDG